jgi:hypothetical protein
MPRLATHLVRKLSLRARLLISFVGIALFVGIVSALLGVGLIHRTMPQVENVLAVDLNAACDFYLQYLSSIGGAARLLAQQRIMKADLEQGEVQKLAASFEAIRQSEDLDILILTDLHGGLLFPSRDQKNNVPPAIALMLKQAVRQRKEIASTVECALFQGQGYRSQARAGGQLIASLQYLR